MPVPKQSNQMTENQQDIDSSNTETQKGNHNGLCYYWFTKPTHNLIVLTG